jgi:hypothetical protein
MSSRAAEPTGPAFGRPDDRLREARPGTHNPRPVVMDPGSRSPADARRSLGRDDGAVAQIIERARRIARATASVRPLAPSLVTIDATWNLAV